MSRILYFTKSIYRKKNQSDKCQIHKKDKNELSYQRKQVISDVESIDDGHIAGGDVRQQSSQHFAAVFNAVESCCSCIQLKERIIQNLKGEQILNQNQP